MVVESPDSSGAALPRVAAETMVARQLATVSREAVQIQSSAKNFNAAAGKGFHLDPQAAATLINACRDALTELHQVQQHLDTVSQTPQLGRTPGANVVAPFVQNAATDPEGIRPAITNLQKTLQDMIQGYQKASTNYAETEALIEQAMKQQRVRLAPTILRT